MTVSIAVINRLIQQHERLIETNKSFVKYPTKNNNEYTAINSQLNEFHKERAARYRTTHK